jgi:hypothetical protein
MSDMQKNGSKTITNHPAKHHKYIGGKYIPFPVMDG